jgi:AAA ATPase-like protein
MPRRIDSGCRRYLANERRVPADDEPQPTELADVLAEHLPRRAVAQLRSRAADRHTSTGAMSRPVAAEHGDLEQQRIGPVAPWASRAESVVTRSLVHRATGAARRSSLVVDVPSRGPPESGLAGMPEEAGMGGVELAGSIAPRLMLERGAEMAALEALVEAARRGEGRLAVVEGTAGIGKTRLLSAARELALAAGVDVLSARGGELEGEFAFGIVRQLFEAPLAVATSETRGELLAGAAALCSSLFASAPPETPLGAPESSFAMLHGLYWLAANFALRNPTLLLVDDLNWADEPSLRWLVYLARRLDGLPLALIAGSRPAEQADSSALVKELLSDAAGFVMRPGGLGRQLSSDELVMALEQLSPGAVAELDRPLAGGDNVREEDRREDAVRLGLVPGAGFPRLAQEGLGLVERASEARPGRDHALPWKGE